MLKSWRKTGKKKAEDLLRIKMSQKNDSNLTKTGEKARNKFIRLIEIKWFDNIVNWWEQSLVVFFNKSHVLTEWNTPWVVNIDLAKVPLDHLFSYRNIQGFEGIFHKPSEFFNINKLVFFSLFSRLLCLLCTVSKEVWELKLGHSYVFIEGDFSIVVLIDAVKMPVKLILGDVFRRDT